MLFLQNITISVEEKTIINNLSLNFELGKNYCLLGKNGSGKSSLAMAVMGHPSYTIDAGSLTVSKDGETIDLLELDPHERAKL